MGTMKEKSDNDRRYSRKGGRTATKESGSSSGRQSSGGEQKSAKGYNTDGDVFDDDAEARTAVAEAGGGREDHRDALAELDNVLNYHSCSSGGKSSSGGSKKAKSKLSSGTGSHNRKMAAVTAGGTWPRTKGGPVIDHGTGTILHPQKVKKERLPLAELLTGLPKYSSGSAAAAAAEKEKKVILRNED